MSSALTSELLLLLLVQPSLCRAAAAGLQGEVAMLQVQAQFAVLQHSLSQHDWSPLSPASTWLPGNVSRHVLMITACWPELQDWARACRSGASSCEAMSARASQGKLFKAVPGLCVGICKWKQAQASR